VSELATSTRFPLDYAATLPDSDGQRQPWWPFSLREGFEKAPAEEWDLGAKRRNRAVHSLQGNTSAVSLANVVQRGGRRGRGRQGRRGAPASASANMTTPLKLRSADWDVPICEETSIGLEGGTPGVVLTTPAGAAEVMARLGMVPLPGAIALVTLSPVVGKEGLECTLPLLRDSRVVAARCFLYQLGNIVVRPKPFARQVMAAASTSELVVEMDEAFLPAGQWELVKTGGLKAMRSKVEALTGRGQLLDCYGFAVRGETLGSRVARAMLRLSTDAKEVVLKASGQGGMFSRPLFRLDEERRQHAVMWVDGDLTSVLLKATTYPPSLGLVRNPRGLGIRVPAGLRSEAYQALMGKSPPPPIHYYEVAGVPLPMAANDVVGVLQTEGWLVKPVRSFLRRGARVWVVAAEQTPPVELLWMGEALVTVQTARELKPVPHGIWKKAAAAVAVSAPHPQLVARPQHMQTSSRYLDAVLGTVERPALLLGAPQPSSSAVAGPSSSDDVEMRSEGVVPPPVGFAVPIAPMSRRALRASKKQADRPAAPVVPVEAGPTLDDATSALVEERAAFQREREEWRQEQLGWQRQREAAAALPPSFMQDTIKLVQQAVVSALVDFREQLQRQMREEMQGFRDEIQEQVQELMKLDRPELPPSPLPSDKRSGGARGKGKALSSGKSPAHKKQQVGGGEMHPSGAMED